MKRCPSCDKTFPDGMKFCQTDGTVLVDDAPPVDPYKTVVGNQSDIAAAIPPVDPFKTMVASSVPPPKVEEDILELPPEQPDEAKTMLVAPDELKDMLKPDADSDVPALDLPPPSPFGSSAPLVEPKSAGSGDAMNAGSPFDAAPQKNDFSQASPYGNTDNLAIPSPFNDSMPPSNQSPSGSPFGESPATPFGQAEPFNQPLQQNEWTPPPAPVAEWQDKGLGADTPFQPPPVGQSLNQTLPIISLVLGIISLCCYTGWLTGPAALIIGFLGMKNVNKDPNQYGGKGLAIAGMVIGGVFTFLWIIYWIFIILVYAGLIAGAAFNR